MDANDPTVPLWKRRFATSRLAFPTWARDAPHRLLYGSAANGRWQLYCHDLHTGRTRRVTGSPTGTTTGAIDPTGQWIWWFADPGGREIGVWRTVRFDGNDPQTPTQPPAHPGGLVIGTDFAVVGSVADQEFTVRLMSGDGHAETIYAHREPGSVAALSSDESLVCIRQSEHGDRRHPAVTVLGRSGKRIADLWDGPGLGLWPGAWSPVRGDNRIIVHHERHGTLRPAIWSPSASGWTDLHVDLPGDTHADWYPFADRLLLRHEWSGRTSLHSYDLSNDDLTAVDTPAGTIDAARVRPDGEIWMLHSSGSQPPRLISNGRPIPIATRAASALATQYRDFWAGDVHCLIAEPAAPRPNPAVFVVHGGPAIHDRDSFSPNVQAWTDHGFTVVMVNYRGSTGYGREWRDAIQNGPGPGLCELEDLASVRQRLTGEGVLDPRRVVLSGVSWGGYLALLALGRQPDLWNLGIAIMPVADLVATYEDEAEPTRAHDRALLGGTPDELPARYAERSPITFVDHVRVPVLLIAGKNDPHCPPRQIANYVARLQESGKSHELYEFAGGHGSLDVTEQINQQARQLAFVGQHLGIPSLIA